MRRHLLTVDNIFQKKWSVFGNNRYLNFLSPKWYFKFSWKDPHEMPTVSTRSLIVNRGSLSTKALISLICFSTVHVDGRYRRCLSSMYHFYRISRSWRAIIVMVISVMEHHLVEVFNNSTQYWINGVVYQPKQFFRSLNLYFVKNTVCGRLEIGPKRERILYQQVFIKTNTGTGNMLNETDSELFELSLSKETVGVL